MAKIQTIAAAFSHTVIPHLVVSCDSSHTVRFANAALCNLIGQSQEELLGTSIFIASARLLELLALTEPQLIQLFEQVRVTKTSAKRLVSCHDGSDRLMAADIKGCFCEIYPIMEGSEVIHLVIQVVVLKGALLSDTFEFKQQNHSTVAPRQSLEMIMDSLSNVLFTLDVESVGVYRFSFANRAFQVTTGLPVEKVIGKYVHEVIPEPSLTIVLGKYQEAIVRKQQVSWQEVSHYPAGQKTGEVSVIPMFDAAGNCFRLVGMVHDITEHKEAETKQMRLTEDLYQHNRDLEQFTYILSHNLRAPLANALGLVRHLPDVAAGTEKFNQYVSYLTTSIENLDKVLKDLNQILSIRDRQNLFDVEPVALTAVCSQVGEALKAELAQAGGQLKIDIDPSFKVQASRAYLYSICYNLISNAIKYRSKDRPLHINVTSDSTMEEEPAIHFTDNGSGIDLEKTGKDIFKLYKRFHSGTEGRGIGLFLVKTHLEAMEGHIKVQSKPNRGTTFSVFFKELVR
ncbi:PAS domain-containing sensor histidine kinase [Pontibacter sp. 172403-2]|uniref:PAS domain-containing sensor histidine kinase n=1 Tax=Pontibacter rufus TaxID=2791028 RepID=UPI0018AF618C|nr:PAS domain-containing sensor histidine kinase [Pontibacter sp. 172403-2]MBF9255804.1 PAS domain-containing sensor histidine kinase [Pontibacter sp. 172403-2]